MKIAVLGTGAMGSVYAGLLATAGHDVWAIDHWTEHVEAIRAQGLRVEGASGDRVARLEATIDPREVGEVELVIIATKAPQAESAARDARPLLGPDTAVLTIQNGLGSADRVATVLGSERVLVGVAGGFGASIVGPGHVHHHGLELVRLGESSGPVTARLERIAAVWREAGFNVRTFDDVNRLVWEKLICNVAFSATCALAGITIGAVIEDPDAWSVASRCATEAYEVARGLGVHVDIEDPTRYVRDFGSTIPDARPSMLLDFIAGRPSEVDVINGAVAPLARQLGLLVPVNETVTALVKAREQGAAGATRR